MKLFSKAPRLRLSRPIRVGIAAAILVVLGALGIYAHYVAPGVILIVIAAVLVAVFVGFVVRPSAIPRGAVIRLRLSGAIQEHLPRSLLSAILGRGAPTLYQIRQALEGAAADPHARGLIVEVSGFEAGLATAQELHELLRGIKGKRTVAVLTGDSVSVREYLVACGANEVVINPDATVMMTGVAAGGVFLKGALEKLQVDAQLLQYKEYKGAAEMFTRERMSPPLRESLEAIVNDWRAMASECIAAARGVEAERASELLGAGFLSARQACADRLIDRVGYVEDVCREFDPQDRGRLFAGLHRYLRHLAYTDRGSRGARIAVVHGLGPVVAGEGPSYGEYISGETTGAQIAQAARDQSVRAIVFRVNSPGGSAVGSDLVWRAVAEARQRGKPVVVSMGDVAGSGGYYVAMGADAIVAEPVTITGSIGVVYMKLSVARLLADFGIRFDFAKSDPISDALSISRPLTDAELGQLNQTVGEMYAQFTAKVAQGRGLDPARTEELARGRVWSGRAALSGGLIDALGGLSRAVEIAREKAGLKPGELHQLVTYPGAGLLASLKLAFAPPAAVGSGQQWLLASALELPEQWLPALLRLLVRGGVTMLCPFF